MKVLRIRRRIAGILAALLLLAAQAATAQTAPTPDHDEDGVPDASDFCPATPRGVAPVVRGCAVFEIGDGVDELLRASDEALSQAVDEIRAHEDIAVMARKIDRAGRVHEKASALLRAGNPCAADRLNARFLQKLTRLAQDLERRIATIVFETARTPLGGTGYGDATETDLHFADLRIAYSRLESAAASLGSDVRSLGQACAGVVGPLRTRGRVVELDDANHRLRLDSGLVLQLVPRRQRGFVSVGMNVEVAGLGMANNTGVATSLVPEVESASFADLEISCLFFRIAPVQPFPPLHAGPLVHHNPLGYRIGGSDEKPRLLIERGQRLMVSDSGCGTEPDENGQFVRYSATMDLSYYAKDNTVKKVTLAWDQTENDDPVRLPDDIHSAAINSSLVVTIRKQTCSLVGAQAEVQCPGVEEVRSQTYALDFNNNGPLCSAQYEQVAFDLEDYDPDGFRATWVTAADPALHKGSPLGGNATDLKFEAEGYGWSAGNSSYPVVQPIYLGNPFSIHSRAKDFFKDGNAWARLASGVERGSGLRFPRLRGKRAGHSFWYSCDVPRVSRDVLGYCDAPAPDTYYRLPFEGGDADWDMGQGNFGEFTHKDGQAYAFDFGAVAGTHVLAARRGRVIAVEEGNSGDCWDADAEECTNCTAPNDANFVAVEHQDGTIARYFHAPKNGIFVSVGQEVVRGTHLGNVGSTGCSTGPHLHFDVLSGLKKWSMEIRFESAVPGHELCYLIENWDSVESTNVELD